MGITDILKPYLLSPMWISIGLSIITLIFLPFLIKYIRKDIWNNFFHIPYWKVFITDGNDVLKTRIINKDLKQSKVKTIEDKPYTWIIKDNSWINFKAGSVIVCNIASCMNINLLSDVEQKLFNELKEEKENKKIIEKIPIINRFFHSKTNYFNSNDRLVGFATKIKTNPEFIINAVTFHIFLKQKFTNDIIKVPKTIWEILEENMTLLIVVSFICIMAFLLLQYAPKL